MIAAEAYQIMKRAGERRPERIVSVVVEALHPPQRIEVFVHARLLCPPATQGRHMPVTDLYAC